MIGTDVYTTGTVSISNGDTTLVGSGTTFTSAMVGRSVWLDSYWYLITSFTDTTHLEIDTFEGTDLTNSAYVISDINNNSIISTLTIQNCSTRGVDIEYSNNPKLDDLSIYNCPVGIYQNYVLYSQLLVFSAYNDVNMDANNINGMYINFSDFSYSTSGDGLVMTNVVKSTFFNSETISNVGNGISMTDCRYNSFVSVINNKNGGIGIEFVSGNYDNQIGEGTIRNNVSDGIKFTGTSDRNSICQISVLSNGGYGVNIANANCDNNVINSVCYDSNTSGMLNDLGTGTIVLPSSNVYLVASSNLKLSADTEQTTTGSMDVYQKKKEILVLFPGIITVKFSIKRGTSVDSYGKIYVNSVAIGTERENNTTSYVEYSENITVKIGDLVQLYIKSNFISETALCQNFRIYYDKTLVATDGVVITN